MFWSLMTFLKIDNKSQTHGIPTRKKSEWTLVEGNKGNKNGGKKRNIGNKKGKKREWKKGRIEIWPLGQFQGLENI